jgi:hypothetical protein
MGVSRSSLFAAFRTEMVEQRVARMRIDARTLLRAAQEALTSRRPSSIRVFVDLLVDMDRRRMAEKLAAKDERQQAKDEKLGKKAGARAAATASMEAVDDDWGADLDPFSVQ